MLKAAPLSQEHVDSDDDSSASPKPQIKKRVKDEDSTSDDEPIQKRVKSDASSSPEAKKKTDKDGKKQKVAVEKPSKKKKEQEEEKQEKRKVGTARRSSLTTEENDDGETFIDLEKNRRVTIRKFKKQTLVDIREFYNDGGDMKPGKKGISLTVQQYDRLKKAMSMIDKAIDELE
ncbi:hypothetical protein JCM11641_007076 [Rhodosporidiobolus odoratus]